MRDLGETVPQVSFEDMKKHFLPQLNGIDFDAVKDLLIIRGHLVDNSGRKVFSNVVLSKETKRENEAFKPLKNIFEQVIKCTKDSSGKEAILYYVHAGNSTPVSELTNTSQPDGYGILLKDNPISTTSVRKLQQIPDEWFDMCFPDELKKKDGRQDSDDDVGKIIWIMQHVMHNDPRRRFTFGFTIENTTTRIWFCCRQAVVVSEKFDFMEDSDQLIYFIISMCFATPTELGWDPTVTLQHIDGKWQYDFKVGENVYRTIQPLSTFSADALCGRATRKAKLLSHGKMTGEEVALKDSWCDWSRDSEKKFLDEVLKEATPDEKNYFLTIVEEENVKIDGEEDDTEKMIMRGFEFTDRSFPEFMLPNEYTPIQGSRSTGYPEHMNQAPTMKRRTYQFNRKIHRRTVFKEVGTPIYQLTSTKKIFSALLDVVKALEIMFKKKYVHRDVSIGNVLVFKGQGKLTDLEYAEVMGTEAKHNVRTGTLDFMSIEAERRIYHYKPLFQKLEKSFFHNPLHDLESVWWIATWCLFWNTPINGNPCKDVQKSRAESIFARKLGNIDRFEFFDDYDGFMRGVKGMYFQKWSDSILDNFRLQLLLKYKEAEEKDIHEWEIKEFVFQTLHRSFRELLEEATKIEDLELEPLTKATDRRKRKASASVPAEASSSKKSRGNITDADA